MNVSPSSVSIHLSTKQDWQHVVSDEVRVPLAGDAAAAATKLEAAHGTFDPLWDGPYAQPAQPGDWRRVPGGAASAQLQQSVGALRDAIAGVDLATAHPYETTAAASYATIHLTFPSRPEGIDHLRPFQDAHGAWTVGLRTSLDDLFADPALAPVVDAARAVLAAARPAA